MIDAQPITKRYKRGVDFELDIRPVPAGAAPDDDRVTALMGRVESLHDDVLKLSKPRTKSEVIRNVLRATEVVFAVTKDDEPQDIGVIVQTVRTVTIGGNPLKAVMIAMRAVLPPFQAYGISGEFTNDAIDRHNPDGFTGRTPNPNLFRAYKKIPRIGEIFPIDGLYPPEMQRYMAVLLSDAELSTTNLETGRSTEVYPRGVERLFTINPKDKEMMRILTIMTSPPISANLDAGDGVRYWASVIPGPRGNEGSALPNQPHLL